MAAKQLLFDEEVRSAVLSGVQKLARAVYGTNNVHQCAAT